jgi:hypothetical protein
MGYAGLKIRARTPHQHALTCNVFIHGVLAFSQLASVCTKVQQTEANPAPNPAPDFCTGQSGLAIADCNSGNATSHLTVCRLTFNWSRRARLSPCDDVAAARGSVEG